MPPLLHIGLMWLVVFALYRALHALVAYDRRDQQRHEREMSGGQL